MRYETQTPRSIPPVFEINFSIFIKLPFHRKWKSQFASFFLLFMFSITSRNFKPVKTEATRSAIKQTSLILGFAHASFDCHRNVKSLIAKCDFRSGTARVKETV